MWRVEKVRWEKKQSKTLRPGEYRPPTLDGEGEGESEGPEIFLGEHNSKQPHLRGRYWPGILQEILQHTMY